MVSHAQCPPSAAGSRQGAMQAVGYGSSGGYGGRQGSGAQREGAAEGSAERTTPSSATPMVLPHYTKLSNADGTAHCGRVGSRHFQSLEEQSLRLFVCIWNLPCPVAALGIGLANDCCIMSVKPIAKWPFAACPSSSLEMIFKSCTFGSL